MKILKSVKLKQRDADSEVLVTAVDVKCHFTQPIHADQGEMLNIVSELLEEGLETRHFKGLFLKP